MTKDELKLKAKELGVKNYYNKKPETLIKEIEDIENQVTAIKSETKQTFMGFTQEEVTEAAGILEFDKLEYCESKQAFKAFRDSRLVDLIGNYAIAHALKVKL